MASFDQMLQSLSGFEEDVYNSEFNVSKFLLPDLEAAKKLLMMKNPGFKKEDADMIFDAKDKLLKKMDEVEEKRKEKEEERNLSKEEKQKISAQKKEERKKKRQEEREKRKAQAKQLIEEFKEVYKEKAKELLKQAKDVKQQIKEAAYNLWKELKELVKKLIMTIIQTASSIPAIIITISAPPWNVPKAISYTLVVVESYMNIIKLLKDLLPWLTPLKLLPLVTEKKNLKVLATIFDVIIKALRAFWIPIKFLDKLIKALLAAIGAFLKRNRGKIFTKATRKLKKLGHLYKLNWYDPTNQSGMPESIFAVDDAKRILSGRETKGILRYTRGLPYPGETDPELPEASVPGCFSYDSDDVDEIQDILRIFEVGEDTKIGKNGEQFTKQTNRVYAYKTKKSTDAKLLGDVVGYQFSEDQDYTEFDFDDLSDKLDRVVDTLPKIPDDVETSSSSAEELERFVYDIKLPDGTVIQSISEEGVEAFKTDYILSYYDNVTQTFQDETQFFT